MLAKVAPRRVRARRIVDGGDSVIVRAHVAIETLRHDARVKRVLRLPRAMRQQLLLALLDAVRAVGTVHVWLIMAAVVGSRGQFVVSGHLSQCTRRVLRLHLCP